MALDYKTGQGVMLQLGSFQFGVSTAAYQELKRSTEWRWPAQDQFGRLPALQFVGPSSDTITLPGVIYPEYRGGLGLLDALRALADAGEPQMMIDGRGNILGKWVIERVEEGQQVFADGGVPRKMEFTLGLRRIQDDSLAKVAPFPVVVSAAAGPAIPAGATSAADQVTGLADSVVSSATAQQGRIASAAAAVQASVTPATGMATSVTGAVQRCSDLAGELIKSAVRVRAMVAKNPAVAATEARVIMDKANRVMTSAQSAGVLLRRSTGQLEGMAGAPAGAVGACRNAASAAEGLVGVCRKAATEAAKIGG